MAVVTLADLSTRVRQAADMEKSTFIKADELRGIINRALTALDDMLYDTWTDHRLVILPFTFTADTYTLPTDFYRLRTLDVRWAGRWKGLAPFMHAERNALRNATGVAPDACRYQLHNLRQLRLLPGFRGAQVPAEVAYYPQRAPLVLDTDTAEFPNGWEEWAVLSAAIVCKTKEERDPGTLVSLLGLEAARLEKAAPAQDSNAPKRVVVTDVEGMGGPWAEDARRPA